MTKEEIMAKAYARKMFAFELRSQGLTFSDIGKKLNVCGNRARNLYLQAKTIIMRKNQNGN